MRRSRNGASHCGQHWLVGTAPLSPPESALRDADIDPGARGETLSVTDFARLAGVSEQLATPAGGGRGGGDFQSEPDR